MVTSNLMATSNSKGTITYSSPNGRESWRQWSHRKESSKDQPIGVLGESTVDRIGLECSMLRGHHDTLAQLYIDLI